MLGNLIAAAESSGSAMTMTEFLATGSEVAQWLWSQTGIVSSTAMSNPMIAVPFYIFIAGASIGFFGRLLHL